MAWAVLAVAGASDTSVAQTAKPTTLPTAVLFSTASSKGSGAPLDSVLHAALEELGVVNVTGRPGMDLNAVQLAIDCVSETPQCLRAVASQTGAQVLVAPSIQSTPSEIVISLLRFDSTDGQLRRVVRRQRGSSLKPETLDGVPSMLRELFELPEPPPKAATPEPATPPPSEATESERSWQSQVIEPPQDPEDVHRPMPVGPWIVAGAGALVLGGGAIFGVLSANTEDEYHSRTLRNSRDVDEIIDLRDTGETQATVANVMFAVGGAAIVAGGIWLAVELGQSSRSDADWQTALVPSLGPGQAGLSLVHRGGGL